MDNVIMLKTGSPAPESLDDWKAYIAAASQIEKQAGQSLVDAIIEKGKRIAEFHAAYKAKGQKWGKRWDDVCQKTIGISEDMCRRYETVGKNMQRDSLDILPPALEVSTAPVELSALIRRFLMKRSLTAKSIQK